MPGLLSQFFLRLLLRLHARGNASLGGTLPTSSYRQRWIEICNPFGDTFATLQSLLEAPAGAEQIDLNVPRETNGPIFDIPFYIGDSGSSCLSSNLSLHDSMGVLLSGEGREAHTSGRKRQKNVGNFTDKLPGLNGNMEDMLVAQRREVVSRRRANAVKITGWQPDLNANSCDLRERQMPVQRDSRKDHQQSAKRLLYREGGQNDGVIPNPLSLNKALGNVTGAATVAVEYSAERSVLNTNGPASSGAKMSHTIQTMCQEALNMIKRLIDEKGREIMPFSLSSCRQIMSSVYRMNVSGTNILNFQKNYQRLDQRDYYGLLDFVADVQFTLKCMADRYPLYSPIRDEAQKIEVLFFDIMKRMFPYTNFQQLQNQVQNLAQL